jgi:hypothetical protein
MKKSEQKFAQRAIHSLQDSRNSLTEAEELKSSRTSTTLANQQVFKKNKHNRLEDNFRAIIYFLQ